MWAIVKIVDLARMLKYTSISHPQQKPVVKTGRSGSPIAVQPIELTYYDSFSTRSSIDWLESVRRLSAGLAGRLRPERGRAPRAARRWPHRSFCWETDWPFALQPFDKYKAQLLHGSLALRVWGCWARTENFVPVEKIIKVDTHVSHGKVNVDILEPHHFLTLFQWEINITRRSCGYVSWKQQREL